MATAGRGGVQVKSIKDYIDEQHSNIPSFMRRKSADEIERSDTEKAKGLRDFFSSTGGSRGRGANPTTNSTTKPSVKPKPTVVITPDDNDLGNAPSNNISAASNKEEPAAVIKKTEIVKTAPVVSKPKVSAPTKSSRNSMADEWAAFSKGREADTAALKDITDRYKQTGTLVKSEDSDLPKPSELKDSDFKKGGMTKRPPKPAKKVPARKFASGGSTSRTSASKRGDGCATKGHTKGKYL
jgi:hypothetical protein